KPLLAKSSQGPVHMHQGQAEMVGHLFLRQRQVEGQSTHQAAVSESLIDVQHKRRYPCLRIQPPHHHREPISPPPYLRHQFHQVEAYAVVSHERPYRGDLKCAVCDASDRMELRHWSRNNDMIQPDYIAGYKDIDYCSAPIRKGT